MATAKLWWNGSSWKTASSTLWVDTHKTGNNQLGIGLEVKIVAYDDFKIKMTSAVAPYQTAALYNTLGMSGTLTFKSGSTTLGTNNFQDKDITNYSSISYSGTVYADGNAQGVPYSSGALSFSGSTTLTTPFYTVSYDLKGGSGEISATKGVKGFSSKLTATEPTKTGYTFAGWNTEEDLSGTTYEAGATLPSRSSDKTMYAVWTANEYDVIISAGEGTTITFDGVQYSNQTITVQKTYAQTYSYSITANTGYLLKTYSPALSGAITIDLENPSITATAQRVGCFIDDGNQSLYLIYIDNGAQWELYLAYIDNGAQWELQY